MQFKKYIHLILSFTMLAGACLFTTGCGEKSDTDKAADAVEDATKGASDALKGATK
jgi:hypothetical protein